MEINLKYKWKVSVHYEHPKMRYSWLITSFRFSYELCIQLLFWWFTKECTSLIQDANVKTYFLFIFDSLLFSNTRNAYSGPSAHFI